MPLTDRYNNHLIGNAGNILHLYIAYRLIRCEHSIHFSHRCRLLQNKQTEIVITGNYFEFSN